MVISITLLITGVILLIIGVLLFIWTEHCRSRRSKKPWWLYWVSLLSVMLILIGMAPIITAIFVRLSSMM